MKKLLSTLAAFTSLCLALNGKDCDVAILAVGDIQYATYAPKIGRNFANSPKKLTKIRLYENGHHYDFLVNLGDTIDSKFENFQTPLSELKKFGIPFVNILGNHDFNCSSSEQNKVLKLLFQNVETYRFFDIGKWRFVILDAMRLSHPSEIANAACESEFKKLWEKLKAENAKSCKPWNGGIDKTQRDFLEHALADADSKKMNAAIFCHMPIYFESVECLLNGDEVAKILERHSSAKLWIAGHKHSGAYTQENGIHYFTLAGLVEGDTVSYARIFLKKDSSEIVGFGNTISKKLKFKNTTANP